MTDYARNHAELPQARDALAGDLGPEDPQPNLWGSETRFGVSCGQSGGDVVLVGESAEDLPPADPVVGEVDQLRRLGVSLSWGELAEETMRPGIVIVHQVFGQHLAQVM